jgi:putative addiction module killer protein
VEASEREILYYVPKTGPPAPFRVWRDGITDKPSKLAITARIARMRGGNFSDSKPVGSGASENRIDFGPGFRIYYGVDGEKIILLCGGDKSTQERTDIETAIDFWTDYKERKKNEERRKLQSRSSRRTKK